jgi:hypothetical protein
MNDNIGKFHHNTYRKLKGKAQAKCFVNPDNPSEAVMVRSLRVDMLGFFAIFLIAFGGFGFGACGYAIYTALNSIQESKNPAGDFLATRSGKPIVIFFSLPTIFFLPIAAKILPEAINQVKAGLTNPFFAAIIPFIALISTIALIYFGLRHLNFGVSTLCVSKGAGTLGGKLQGYIVNNCSPANGFDVIITCNKTTRSGKNSHTQTLYTASHTITNTQMTPNGRYRTDFDLTLPFDLPESSESRVTWNIKFKADVPGPDYSFSCEIPVHKTDESDNSLTKDSILEDQGVSETHPSITKEKILIHRTPERLHIYFPMFRKVGTIIFLFIFLIIWGGLTAFLIHKKVWLFAVIWGLTDALMFVSLIHMMFVSKKLIVSPEGMVFKKGFFGGGKEIHLEANEIEEILIPSNSRQGMNYLKVKAKEIDFAVEKSFSDR